MKLSTNPLPIEVKGSKNRWSSYANYFSEEVIDFHGKYEHIPGAGINPLPPDKKVPIWFGSNAEQATIRAARLGDGWFPGYKSAGDAAAALEMVKKEREAAGKSMKDFGIEPRTAYGDGDPERLNKTR